MKKKTAFDVIGTVLCILFVCVFSLIFLKVAPSMKGRPWYSILSAVLSFSAFACCGVILIRRLSSDVRRVFGPGDLRGFAGDGETGRADGTEAAFRMTWKDTLCISLAVTLFFVFTLLLVEILRIANTGAAGFSHFEWLWSSLDSRHYLYIAEHGYTRDTPDADVGRVVEIVFFPLFPAIVGVLGRVIGSYFIAGLIVSYVSFGAAMYFLFRLAAERYGRISGYAAVAAVMILPGSFFFVAPMTESLFLALTLGTVYFIKKEKWLAAAAMGFFSALTRNLGVLVAVVYVYELLLRLVETARRGTEDRSAKRKEVLKYAARLFFVFLIPAGTVIYLIINHVLYGSAFAFMEYEKSNWSQSLGWFFSTAEYCARLTVEYFRNPENTAKALPLWGMNLFAHFGALALLISRHRRIRTSYYIYSLFYFAISMGATWLLSGTRYMIGLFTVPLLIPGVSGASEFFAPGAGDGSSSGPAKRSFARIIGVCVFAAVMLCVGIFYVTAFVERLQVW